MPRSRLSEYLEELVEAHCTLRCNNLDDQEMQETEEKLQDATKAVNDSFFALNSRLLVGPLLVSLAKNKWDAIATEEQVSFEEIDRVKKTLLSKHSPHQHLLQLVIEYVSSGTQLCADGNASPYKMTKLAQKIDKIYAFLPKLPPVPPIRSTIGVIKPKTSRTTRRTLAPQSS